MVIVVVGGGVVGSWIALELSNFAGNEIFLIEKEPSLWFHTSTRNSGVIHSGIYYEYHTLKRIFCIEGAKKSYEFFKKYNIEHNISGKLIVASSEEEIDTLKSLKENGDFNGVPDLKLISRNEILKVEPFCKSEYALYSPWTGVVNCSDYYRKMEALLQERKVNIITKCEVTKVEQNIVYSSRGELKFDFLINAAGLHSDNIAKSSGLEDFQIVPFKGEYYSLNDPKVNGMIYPVPGQQNHLGIHLTRSAYDEIWIGPTSYQTISKDDYSLSQGIDIFIDACRMLLNDFEERKVSEGFSGIRPKCFHQSSYIKDFLIFRKSNKIHLLGIESPGLTAAPAIANYINKLINFN